MRLLLVILAMTALAACAPAREAQSVEAEAIDGLVWPSAPEPARVRFLYAFHEPKDLGMRGSALGRAFGLFAGKKDMGMVRPYAVAVDGDLIAVADPGLQVLHLFDVKRKKYRRIEEAGGLALSSPVGVALTQDAIFLSDSALKKVFILDRDGDTQRVIAGIERPTGLAFHLETGRLYVADTLAHTINVFDSAGDFLFRFGTRGSDNSELNFPSHLSVSNGRLHVNDTMNFRVQTFDLDGRFISAIGKIGDGSGDMAQPKGLATDAANNVYVADALFNRVQIFDPNGRFLLAVGKDGQRPGEFWLPAGVFIAQHRMYVADSYNRRVQVFELLGGGQ